MSALAARTTPFHAGLSGLDTQGLYTHWQGYLSARRYTTSPKHEYFAVRSGVGIFDSSPLHKHLVHGPDAERLLRGALVRDVAACPPGQAQYTLWCDDRGFVVEDGVVLRLTPTAFLLTTARPALDHLLGLRGRLRVAVDDVSEAYGVLAVQGPRSADLLRELAGSTPRLAPFEHGCLSFARGGPREVIVSRTGFTGDLGYELIVDSARAPALLDAVLDAGAPFGVRPYGEEAMTTLRIEAGLPLLGVDFHSSRYAITDHDRVTPRELGMGWMLRGLREDIRAFVGREALLRELAEDTSRWATVGLVVDWRSWDRLHREAGETPPTVEDALPYELMLHHPASPEQPGARHEAGFVTSFVYSPVLQRHIGLARVRRGLAAPGSEVDLELTMHHRPALVRAHTARLPLFDPQRRKATP